MAHSTLLRNGCVTVFFRVTFSVEFNNNRLHRTSAVSSFSHFNYIATQSRVNGKNHKGLISLMRVGISAHSSTFDINICSMKIPSLSRGQCTIAYLRHKLMVTNR
jgi:hypothetical protein